MPRAARLAVLVNPNNPLSEAFVADIRAAPPAIGRQIEVVTASTSRDIDTAFATLMQKRADALVLISDALFVSSRVQLAALAARHAVPAIYPFSEDAEAGGLMSYGPSNTQTWSAKSASIPVASSRARSQPICRSYGRLGSSWSSTSRPPRRSASKFHRRSLPAPTR